LRENSERSKEKEKKKKKMEELYRARVGTKGKYLKKGKGV